MPDHNPFVQRGHAITHPDRFYGRQREIEQLFNFLRTGQSVSIVGPRRIGKTSLAHYLAHPQIYPTYGLAPQQTCFVYFDCSPWAAEEPGVLYSLLLEGVQAALTAANANFAIATPIQPSLPYRDFRSVIQWVAQQQMRLIFILDEFDALSANSHLSAQFFSSLRALAGPNLIYLTISVTPLARLTFADKTVLSSPFFNIFAQQHLGLFSTAEAQGLLIYFTQDRTIRFTPAILATLLDLAGCHPLFLQIAGYYAFDWLLQQGELSTSPAQTALHDHFLAEAKEFYTAFWSKLSPTEQRLLFLLPLASQADQRTLQQLVDLCLVTNQAGVWRYVSTGFAAFVQQQPGVGNLLNASPVLLEPNQKLLLLRGELLNLSPPEFRLLQCLLEHANRTLSVEDLVKFIWAEEFAQSASSGDAEEPLVKRAYNHGVQAEYQERFKSVLRNLREKLGDKDLITNVRDGGYRYGGTPPIKA